MSLSPLYFYFIITLVFAACNAKQNMSVLTLLPFSTDGQLAHVACNEAIKMVIENVNSRDDILKDYELVQTVTNEGPTATLANAGLVKFFQRAKETNEIISPAVFGPTIACHFSGATAKMLGFVTFSPQCSGLYIARQKSRFHLFSLLSPPHRLLQGLLAFITQVGKWSEFAIVAFRNNPNSYLMGQYLEKQATEHSLKVLMVANVFEITMDTMRQLKKSRARVIAIMIIQRPMCIKFLCLAHRAGIHPPSHVFVFPLFNCLIPQLDDLPKANCSIEVLEEQMTAVFGIGENQESYDSHHQSHSQSLSHSTISSLGYGYETFQRKFTNRTNGIMTLDYQTRLACHDTMMVLVLALNKTEQVLNVKFNKSLLHFREESKFIQELLVNSTLEQTYITLRTGPTKFNHAGDRRAPI